jgi:dTDP-4-dehydrorhamnose 3,5-epimerase
MNLTKTDIEGLIIIEPQIFKDSRGAFFESWNAKKFKQLGINEDFVQDNQSVSSKGVLRGLHFQNPPYAQAKLVRVIEGSVLDVAVDLRKNSPTYGKHFSVILSEKNNKSFFIPKGFAHGFLSLEDNTVFNYKCSDYYNKESEGSLLWNDEDLKIDWQIDNPLVSEKDLQADLFKNFKTKFND